MSVESYPLSWPPGWKRTHYRKRSQFKLTTIQSSTQRVLRELKLLGATRVVVSTNLELRRDGLPYSNQAQPTDGGVAVYFLYRGKSMCFACDTYDKIQENLIAISKTVEALRGMERWGASQMMERAFSGFEALPAKTGRHWSTVLGIPMSATPEMIDSAYRRLAPFCHPDKGGTHDQMSELNSARAAAHQENAK